MFHNNADLVCFGCVSLKIETVNKLTESPVASTPYNIIIILPVQEATGIALTRSWLERFYQSLECALTIKTFIPLRYNALGPITQQSCTLQLLKLVKASVSIFI